MTKEELEKEAEEYASEEGICVCGDEYWSYNDIKQAYLAGAEPREKRIAELEAEIDRLNGDLELWESGACRAINLDKCGVVKELEAQIEKMKCCENCRWEEPSSFCDNCKRLEGQIFADTLTSDNWEIKEK